VYNRGSCFTDEGVEWDVRNINKAINSFLSTEKWIDRKRKLRAGTVHKNVY